MGVLAVAFEPHQPKRTRFLPRVCTCTSATLQTPYNSRRFEAMHPPAMQSLSLSSLPCTEAFAASLVRTFGGSLRAAVCLAPNGANVSSRRGRPRNEAHVRLMFMAPPSAPQPQQAATRSSGGCARGAGWPRQGAAGSGPEARTCVILLCFPVGSPVLGSAWLECRQKTTCVWLGRLGRV